MIMKNIYNRGGKHNDKCGSILIVSLGIYLSSLSIPLFFRKMDFKHHNSRNLAQKRVSRLFCSKRARSKNSNKI